MFAQLSQYRNWCIKGSNTLAQCSNYVSKRLKNFVDTETSYISSRQQSMRANLPTKVLSTLDTTSWVMRGTTAAVVLSMGPSLPVTALITLNLLPTNILRKTINTIHSLIPCFTNVANSSSTTKNLITKIETTQVLITKALTVYQGLLPINWLQTGIVEAIERPVRWFNRGELPINYTKHAIGDWIWALSGVSGELLQNSRLLSNAFLGKTYKVLEYDSLQKINSEINQKIKLTFSLNCDAPIYGGQCYPAISIFSSFYLNTNYFKPISWINTENLAKGGLMLAGGMVSSKSLTSSSINSNLFFTLLGGSLFFNNKFITGVDAGYTTINLQTGAITSISIDLTQLAGTSDISSLTIKYPQQLAQSGLKLYPKLIGNYASGQTAEIFQLVASNVDKVTETFSDGVQLVNETMLTSNRFVEGELKWKYQISSRQLAYPSSSPAIASDGTIYVGSYGGSLYAMYPDGSLKWQYQTCLPTISGYSCSPTIGSDGTIYCSSSNGYLYAIFPNGGLRWQYLTKGNGWGSSTPIGEDGTIYLMANDNNLYAIFPDGSLKWQYSFGVGGSPAVIGNDGSIYIVNEYTLNAIYPNGNLKWQYSLNGCGSSSPAIASNGMIYVTGSNVFGESCLLFAIYPNGSLNWQYPIASSPVSISNDGTIYVVNENTLNAINPDGTLIWGYNSGGSIITSASPAIGSDGTIYFGTNDGYLNAIYTNGGLRWRYQVYSSTNSPNYYAVSSPAIGSDGTVYVGSNDGNLYAIKTKNSLDTPPWPQFQQNNQNIGLQPIQQAQLFDLRYLTLEGPQDVLRLIRPEMISQNLWITVITSPTITPTPTPTPTPTMTTTVTPTMTTTFTYTGTLSQTLSPSNTITILRIFSLTSTNTNSLTLTGTKTSTTTWSPTPTNTDSSTLTNTLTPIATSTTTLSPTISDADTITPTNTYSLTPTATNTLTSIKKQDKIIKTLSSTPTNTDSKTSTDTPYGFNVIKPIKSATPTNTVTNIDTVTYTNTLSQTFSLTSTLTGSTTTTLIKKAAVTPKAKTRTLTTSATNSITSSITLPDSSIVQMVSAGSATIKLQAGVPINVSIDLTQLTGTSDISSLTIKYPQQLAQSSLSVYPSLIGNYTKEQTITSYQLLAQNQNNVNILSIGIKLPNQTLATTFFIDGQLKWRYQTRNSIDSSPAIGSDGTIYVGSGDSSGDSYLYAIYPNSTLKWRYQTGSIDFSSPTIGSDGTIYVGSGDSYLYAVYPNSTLKWRYQTSGSIYFSSPVIGSDGTIYVGSGDSYLYAVYPNSTLKWRYQTSNSINSSPAMGSDGTIYVGSGDSYLYAIYPNSTLKWRYQTSNSINSSPAIGSDGTIYVGSGDSYLYAIYPNSILKWRYQTGSGIDSSPAIGSDGTIYVGSGDSYLYAVYPNSTLKWRYQTSGSIYFSSPVIGSDGTIYVGSGNSYLYAIYPNSTLKWRYQTGSYIYSSPAIGSDGTIYVGSWDSYIYAISSKVFTSTPSWPQFHQNNLHTGVQAAQEQMQLFDLRYLTFSGTPTISGLLNLEMIANQNLPCLLSIVLITKPKTLTQTPTLSIAQTPLSTIRITSDYVTISLQADTPINTLLDLTSLEGINYTSNIAIEYPIELEQNGLNLYPKLIGAYTSGQITNSYQLLAENKNQVELLSLGIQLPNQTSKITFLVEGELKWKYQTESYLRSSPAIASDGTIYVGSEGGFLYAVYPNGMLKWRYQISGLESIDSSPAIATDGTIYVGASHVLGYGFGSLYAIYPNGMLKWRYTTTGSLLSSSTTNIYSSPAIANDGTIYVGSADCYLFSFTPNGNLNWQYQITGNACGILYSSPAIANDGTVYVGSQNNCLYAIYPYGSLRWKYQTDGSITASPAIANDGTIYVGADDGYLYAIYPDGSLKWRYQTTINCLVDSSPAIASDGTIYVGADDTYLYAIYPNGSLKWRYQTANSIYWSSPGIGFDGVVYVGSWNYLYAIYPNGILKWRYQADGLLGSSPAIAHDGTVYIGSSDYSLYAISTKAFSNTSPWPQFHQNNLHTGIQAITTQLQLFDLRSLVFNGIPNTNALIMVKISIDQPLLLNVSINFINNNDEPTATLINTNSNTPTITNRKTLTSTITTTPSINKDTNTYIIAPQQGISILLSSNELFSNGDGILKLSCTLKSGEILPSWLSITFTPKLLSSYISVNTNSIEVIGTIAYVADDNGLKIIDLSNLYEPKLIGDYITTSIAASLTVVDNTVYLATNVAGLKIISIDDPTKPTLLNSYTNVNANNVIVTNNTILVAGTTGLHIFNKRTNQLAGSYLTASPVQSIDVKETTAFIATGSSGLQIVDISDTTRPTLLSSYTSTQFVNSITIIDTKALITDLNLGLQIIDINNLNKPILLGQYNALVAARSITVTGTMTFIVDNNGLQVIDISSVTKPTLLGSYNPSKLSTQKSSDSILQNLSRKYLRGLMVTENSNQTSYLLSHVTITNTSAIVVGNLGLQIIDCTKWTISGTPPNNTNISNYNLLLTATDQFGKNFTNFLQIHIKEPIVISPSESPTTSSTPTPSLSTLPIIAALPSASSVTAKAAESSSNGLYIGLAVGGGIVGITATTALVLYCYKKRQKISRILPSTLKSPNPEINSEEPEITTENPDPTRNFNNRFFSVLQRRTLQSYVPTTEQSQSNPIPFSLSGPSTLDGRELYPHYEEAESRSHSPSSRPLV
ncbi:MAG: PQQ-binding-like beta-propeller repeat protein [Gammaproteobacteria bacterium]